MNSEQEPRCPAGFFQFPGKSPDGIGQSWFIVPRNSFLGQIRTQQIRNKQLEAYLIPATIQTPEGIWEGLERDGKRHALSYVSKSDRFHGDISVQLPPQPNKVFAVYIRETRASHGQLIIDYWEHVPEDPDRPGFPEQHRTRYAKRLWPPTE